MYFMREQFDMLLDKDIRLGKLTLKFVHIVFMLCVLIISFFIRFSLRHLISGDMDGALAEWMNTIRSNGGFASLRLNSFCYNYNCPYMYILCLLSYLDESFSYMYYIKLVSIIFDYLASFIVFLIIYELTADVKKSLFGFAAVLLAPTIFLNSAGWGQCDIIYVTFLLLSFYFLQKNKQVSSMIFVGLAFSFKLQAVFFFPFLIILWLCKKIKLINFIMVPVVYFLTAIPAMLFGKSLSDIISIYTGQADFYSALTMSYPNIYIFLDNNKSTSNLSETGLIFAIAVLGCLMFYIYTKKVNISSDTMLTIILLSVSITVYCLPHMHERYGFILDLFSIIYGIAAKNPKKIFVTISFQAISLLAYMPYLFRSEGFSLMPVAVFFFALICYIGKDLYAQLQKTSQS